MMGTLRTNTFTEVVLSESGSWQHSTTPSQRAGGSQDASQFSLPRGQCVSPLPFTASQKYQRAAGDDVVTSTRNRQSQGTLTQHHQCKQLTPNLPHPLCFSTWFKAPKIIHAKMQLKSYKEKMRYFRNSIVSISSSLTDAQNVPELNRCLILNSQKASHQNITFIPHFPQKYMLMVAYTLPGSVTEMMPSSRCWDKASLMHQKLQVPNHSTGQQQHKLIPSTGSPQLRGKIPSQSLLQLIAWPLLQLQTHS